MPLRRYPYVIQRVSKRRSRASPTHVVIDVGLCNTPNDTEGRSSMSVPDDQPSRPSPEALIERIAQRNQAALAELYDATAVRVYALALRMVHDQASADEVVSDTYCQVWNQAARYDAARGRALAWIMSICRSRALDRLRGLRAAPLRAEPALPPAEIVADGASPLDILLATERSSAINAALATLAVQDRLLLSLAFFKGMTHQEIARHTGLPLGTVKSAIRRSMQTLRAMLERAELGAKELS